MRFLDAKGNGAGALGALLVVGGVLVVGCAGKSESNRDEDNDSRTGGSGGTGGTNGASGSVSFGGTGSGQTSCVTQCERAEACPGAGPLDCAESCREIAAEGCPNELERVLACFATQSDACNTTLACSAEIDDYSACLNGGTAGTGGVTGTGGASGAGAIGGAGGSNCTPSTPSTNVDCVPVCQRAQACPYAEPLDCAQECASEEAKAATAGCAFEYDAFLGCASTCQDLCYLTESDCPVIDDYIVCVQEYCALNPSSPVCTAT